MKFNTFLKLLFIFGFILIHKQEIGYLPSPLTSINMIFDSSLTILPFLCLLVLIFSIIPCAFFTSIVLCCVKYQILIPSSFPNIFKVSVTEYFQKILDSFLFLTLYWSFKMPYEPEDYFFIRFASIFPKTAISNIYMAELALCLFINLGFFYCFVFLVTIGRIINKFPLLPTCKAFYVRNWSFSACVFPVILYHIGMGSFILVRMLDSEPDSASSVRVRIVHMSLLLFSFIDSLAIISSE